MMSVRRADPTSLPSRGDALHERIDAGEWLPREALPSVAALSGEYGVSPSTAGRVIRVLADEGKVITVKGWGTFAWEP
jgi:DNA-binding GntR family transcriptional regulator